MHIWGWSKMLKVENLRVSYGGIEAVKGISFEVPEKSIVTLIGSNGAGKSTTLRAISGLVKPSGGKIYFEGKDITNQPTEKLIASGLGMTPEGRKIFYNLSVMDNIRIGAYLRKDDISSDVEWMFELFPRLKERSWQRAGTLSGGEQQMLCIARALMSRPRFLMMDEPSLGLAPLFVKTIFDIIKKINETGVTILLIEQNASQALQIADTGYVLKTGTIAMSGTGQELLANEDVKNAYLSG